MFLVILGCYGILNTPSDKSAFCDITLLEVVQDDATIPIKRRNVTITLFIVLLFRFNV